MVAQPYQHIAQILVTPILSFDHAAVQKIPLRSICKLKEMITFYEKFSQHAAMSDYT